MAGESTSQSRWMPLRSISGRTAWHASSSASWMRIGRGSMRSAPLTTRDMSTRSSSSCRWRSALRRMTLSASRTSVGRSRRGSSTCVQPRMAFSGLRSSCENRGEELVTPLRRLERGGAEPRELVDRFLQLADADGVFPGAAGRAGRGRFGGGLAVVAAATEPERAGQRDRAGHHPHGPRDGRAEREQQRGRKSHARMHSNNAAGRAARRRQPQPLQPQPDGALRRQSGTRTAARGPVPFQQVVSRSSGPHSTGRP